MRVTAFTDSGYFWLPGDDDQSHQVAGTLAVSETGVVTLETFGYLSDGSLSLAQGSWSQAGSMQPRIFGYTRDRGAVTLIDGIGTRSSLQAPATGALFASYTILAKFLLVGRHFGDHGPLFDQLTCKIDGLDEWLGVSGITAVHDFDTHRATITFEAPAPLPFQAGDDIEGRIAFGYSIPSPAPWATEAQVSQSAYIELSALTPWTTEDVINGSARMRDFLCLATDVPVAITTLDGYLRDEDDEDSTGDRRARRPVSIFFESRQHSPDPAAVQPWSMNFAHRDLGNGLSDALSNWFDLCQRWPQPTWLFFDARYGDGVLQSDIQFLKVVESMETLAPARGIGKNSELLKKVQRLAEPFADLLGIAGSEVAFAERVRATRNWYVHHDDRWKEQASDGSELLSLLWQCEALLICHLTAFVLGDADAAIRLLADARPMRRRIESA